MCVCSLWSVFGADAAPVLRDAARALRKPQHANLDDGASEILLEIMVYAEQDKERHAQGRFRV